MALLLGGSESWDSPLDLFWHHHSEYEESISLLLSDQSPGSPHVLHGHYGGWACYHIEGTTALASHSTVSRAFGCPFMVGNGRGLGPYTVNLYWMYTVSGMVLRTLPVWNHLILTTAQGGSYYHFNTERLSNLSNCFCFRNSPVGS